MKREGNELSQLAAIMTPFPQVLLNLRVRQKRDPEQVPEFASLIRKIQEKFANRGRILVRPSGTENLIRVMVEGENEKEISGCIQRKMGE